MPHPPRRFRLALTLPVAGAVALAGLSAGEVQAQARSGGSTPGDGDWSVMFTIFEPDEVANFGLFRMLGDRLNLGLEVDLNRSSGEQRVDPSEGVTIRAEGSTWMASVGPSLRWYGSRIGPVSPYLRTKVAVGWGGSDLYVNDERQEEEDTELLAASLGIGAEWYPIRWLGVGGHTGIAWERTETQRVNDSSEIEFSGTTRNLRTFRSGLVVSFYFR